MILFNSLGISAAHAGSVSDETVVLYDVHLTERRYGHAKDTHFDEVEWDLEAGTMTFYQSWYRDGDEHYEEMFTVTVNVVED